MGTKLSRIDFRQQYPNMTQGLFIFSSEKRLPKNQPVVNVGLELSHSLLSIDSASRSFACENYLRKISEEHTCVTFSHIEILFTPSLNCDAVGSILALCRNKKVCICWPGLISGEMLIYAEPSSPEYYETDYTRFIDTYVITE